jgi:hypothetical protein
MSYPRPSDPTQPSALKWSGNASGWVGWVAFAATMLVVIGILSVISGLAALLRDESYFTTANGRLLVFDYTTWGWIHIVIGVILAGSGVALYRGSLLARIVAVVAVGLNLIAQFTWVDAAPWWSVIMIAIDVTVIYAIIVHGGELREADRDYMS